jgi:MerR family transcriptional regulator, redox-sensitive transcriptional activator SoxR
VAVDFSVGQIGARAGLAPSAVRWYEAQGLITSTRTPGGARRYPRSVLRRLAFVRAAQNVGLSLAEIRAALDSLPEGRTPTARDWTQLSAGWRSRLDDQIAALTQLRDGLDSCIGCGCLSLDRCALSNAGDLAAREGPGARWLHPALRAGRQAPGNGRTGGSGEDRSPGPVSPAG